MTELLVESGPEGVLVLRLNRPERRNALSTSLLREIVVALEGAGSDDAIRCVIVTGGDKIFAAGADIAEVAEKSMTDALADPRKPLWARLREFQKPLIAAVEGWCLGAGCELMMCCDLVIAGMDAKFGQPETNLGIMPGAGGTATLTRLVGRALAMKMVLLGDPITALEARDACLITDIVETGTSLAAATAMAEKISRRAPIALRQAKASIKATFDLPHDAHLSLERQYFASLFATDDKREGVTAFGEKRAPLWKNK
jgi:enoyl-CoA hydratase